MTELEIAEPLAMKDLSQFVSRAHRLDPQGAMRLQVSASVLVLTVAPLYPHGIGDSTPLVLGMRMLRLSGSGQDGLDAVVPLSNLQDRLARDSLGTTLPVPPNTVLVSWAGVAPPKGRWTDVDAISSSALRAAAEEGIAEVGQGTPEGAGSHAVSALRARVWSRELGADRGTSLPAGIGFAAQGLGFLTTGETGGAQEHRVLEAPGWLRVVTPGGHLLTRSNPRTL